MKAVILDYQSLAATDLHCETLFATAVDWQIYDYTTATQTAQRIQDAHIVLSNKVAITRELMAENPQLALIIVLATGTNNVDLVAAKERGIAVCNIQAYSTESVVQHTFASLLYLQNHLAGYDQSVTQGQWSASPTFTHLPFSISELAGKTLGIIGYGAIGQRVAQVAQAFAMQVMVSQSRVPERMDNRPPLTHVLAKSDVISIHAPLSPYSKNMLSAEEFMVMKPNAILLNMGRGGIVDEQALLQALQRKKIAAAALDVLAQEPPEANHPLIDYAKNHTNLLLTPHVAWASREARQALIAQVERILQAYLSKQSLPNQVA